MIAQGSTNMEIADLAHLSINSVKTHIRSCYRLINVDSRKQAVLWSIAHGFQPDYAAITRIDAGLGRGRPLPH